MDVRKKSWWVRSTSLTGRLPLAFMMLVPMGLTWGYGRRLVSDPEVWSTPAPMLLGVALIGLLTMIAGIYLLAESVQVKDTR